MGNVESQVEGSDHNDYITEQKKIIIAQQEQIERLSRMNLRTNILQQQQQQQQYKQQQQH